VVSLTEELAVKQAAQADAEIAAGKYRGPLHGIPWGAKDLLAVKGYKTTFGASPYKDQTIDVDATVFTRLSEAGAVLAAKLTLGALAMGDRWFGGQTKSPWDPTNPTADRVDRRSPSSPRPDASGSASDRRAVDHVPAAVRNTTWPTLAGSAGTGHGPELTMDKIGLLAARPRIGPR
jgi:Asp-tRNA(Asn)/Glu-tRNA(Gln) amidotransferase A subunit family amidase